MALMPATSSIFRLVVLPCFFVNIWAVTSCSGFIFSFHPTKIRNSRKQQLQLLPHSKQNTNKNNWSNNGSSLQKQQFRPFRKKKTSAIKVTAISSTRATTKLFFEYHVAPMQGYTNAPLRYFLRQLSSDSILWTEMEKVQDLLELKQKAAEYSTCITTNKIPVGLVNRFGYPLSSSAAELEDNNRLVTLQVGGNNIERMEECIRYICYDMGYDFHEINLNCGCPSIEKGGGNYGASLMKQPKLTKNLLEAIANGCQRNNKCNNNKISLKCRIAVWDHPPNEEENESNSNKKEQDFQYLCQYISQAEQSGCLSHLILHARPVILSGMNVVKNRQIPKLDYSIVKRIAKEFPQLKVTLNGGIQSLSQLEKIQKNHTPSLLSSPSITSYMAGRWMLQRPLELVQIQQNLLSSSLSSSSTGTDTGSGADTGTSTSGVIEQNQPQQQQTPSLFSITLTAIKKYVLYMERDRQQHYPHQRPLADICLPLYLVIEQLRVDYDRYDDLLLPQEDNTAPTTLSTFFMTPMNLAEMELLYKVLKDAILLLLLLEGYNPTSGTQKGNKKQRKYQRLASSDDINFKALNNIIKDLVGTKVVNKWKRNRAEL